DPYPQSNDPYQCYLSVGAANLVLKFSKWREENYAIQVSPAYAPWDSHNLFEAVRAVNPNQNLLDRLSDVRWKFWGEMLEPNFHLLQGAFKEENFATTKEKISEMRRLEA